MLLKHLECFSAHHAHSKRLTLSSKQETLSSQAPNMLCPCLFLLTQNKRFKHSSQLTQCKLVVHVTCSRHPVNCKGTHKEVKNFHTLRCGQPLRRRRMPIHWNLLHMALGSSLANCCKADTSAGSPSNRMVITVSCDPTIPSDRPQHTKSVHMLSLSGHRIAPSTPQPTSTKINTQTPLYQNLSTCTSLRGLRSGRSLLADSSLELVHSPCRMQDRGYVITRHALMKLRQVMIIRNLRSPTTK